MPLMLWQGKLLVVDGKLAMHERCCCKGGGGGQEPVPCDCPDDMIDKDVSVSFHVKITDHGVVAVDEDRTVTMTRDPGGGGFACYWEGAPFYHPAYAVTYSGIDLVGSCDDESRVWELTPGFPCGTSHKATGATPAGAYPSIDCTYATDYRFEITSLVVTVIP